MTATEAMTLAETVRLLHRLRTAYAEAKQLVDTERAALLAAFEQGRAVEIGQVERFRADLERIEAQARRLAVEAFGATGDKHPAPGVAVKLVRRVDYDPARALAWAKEKGVALALDKTAFDSLAKAEESARLGLGIDFIAVIHEPQPTIARDLGAVFALEQESEAEE